MFKITFFIFNQNPLQVWDLPVLFKEDRNLNSSSFRIAKWIIALIDSHNIDQEEIAAKSQLHVTSPFDYKTVYDRIAVLSKRDWESAYAFAEKKQIFNNL